jgi:hypothetical protein
MSLSGKLGKSYSEVKDQAKIKKITVELGEISFDLKVKIPLKKEMEKIIEEISIPNPEKIELIYNKYAEPIKKSIEDGGANFLEIINKEKETIIVLDNDIVIDGSSIKQVATLSAMYEKKVEKYFSLLQSEIGEPINESFAEISDEFPEQVIKHIVEEIEKAIKPTYDSVKKN